MPHEAMPSATAAVAVPASSACEGLALGMQARQYCCKDTSSRSEGLGRGSAPPWVALSLMNFQTLTKP